MSGYDSWLEKPYRDQDAANARFERHIEKCGYCSALERYRHTDDCDQCGDDWHDGPCTEPDCECPEGALLSDNTIADLQNKCADNADQAAYDAYIDRKIDERLGK